MLKVVMVIVVRHSVYLTIIYIYIFLYIVYLLLYTVNYDQMHRARMLF